MTKLLIAIVIVGVVIRIVSAERTTGWLSHDEEAHSNYAHSIWLNNELPTQAFSYDVTSNTGLPHEYENYQQPLYYMLLSPLGASSQAMRYATIAIWLVTAALMFLLTKDFIVISFLSLAPAVIYITGFITNDSLLLCASAMTALGLSRRSIPIIAIGAFILALTKLSGIVIVGALLVYAIIKWRMLIPTLTLALVAGMLVFISRLHLASSNSQVWQFGPGKLWDMVTGTLTSFTLPESQGIAALMAGITSMAFIVYVTIKSQWGLASICVVTSVVALWFIFSLSHFHYIGRLLFPAIPFALIPSMSRSK